MAKEKLNLLGDILKKRGIKSQFVAENLNVSKATVSGWVTNTHQPSVEALYQLAALLNIGVRQLLNPDVKLNTKENQREHKTEKPENDKQ
jgi:transcriptional regulator with XRE-family HTH domain